MSRPTRWGVLSTARIGVDHVIPAIRSSAENVVVALAGRDPVRTAEIASALGIDRSYGDYEALLADAEIDCVYIPLPNSLHCEWTCRFLETGRAVLCEKPLATTVAECEKMVSAATSSGALLGEGFMYRFHPQFEHLMSLIADGVLGDVRVVRGSIGFVLSQGQDIRARPELGGGALLDVGCYPLDAAGIVFGAEPVDATGFGADGPAVDELGAVVLRYPDDRIAMLDYNFRLPWLQAPLEVLGSRGLCRLNNAYNPGRSQATGTLIREGGKPEPLSFERTDMYRLMIDEFGSAVRGERTPRYGIEQSLVTARAAELVRRALTGAGR